MKRPHALPSAGVADFMVLPWRKARRWRPHACMRTRSLHALLHAILEYLQVLHMGTWSVCLCILGVNFVEYLEQQHQILASVELK